MKRTFLLSLVVLAGVNASADASKFEVKVVDLTNLARSTALEACGTAKHTDGKKPLLVTITHDQSKYTTLTDEAGNWCVVFKRWTNSGKIAVEASTMDFSEKSGATVR